MTSCGGGNRQVSVESGFLSSILIGGLDVAMIFSSVETSYVVWYRNLGDNPLALRFFSNLSHTHLMCIHIHVGIHILQAHVELHSNIHEHTLPIWL